MSRHSISQSQRGYSLAEVLMAVAVFALIFVAALTVYDQSNKVFKRGVEAAETQQNVRVAFDKLVADLRMAGFDFDRDGVPTAAAGSPWVPNRTYGIGNMVVPQVANGFLYRMESVAGAGTSCTSGGGPPAWSTTIGNIVADNNCRWRTLQGINQFQQPDEQIEFAHPSAITIRANYDFELNQPGDAENGREPALESAQFPVVTTGNDEIVTYALKSAKPGTLVAGNNYDILFYADTDGGRLAYPGGRAGGENQVRIPNVNVGQTSGNYAGQTCTATAPCFPDAPYTLYRFTLGANGTTVTETPLATNIRSIRFEYYNNNTGVPPATVPTDWASTTQLTNPGGGQFNPSIPAQGIALRAARTQIRSVRLTIVGMSEAPEPNYQNPLESGTSNVRDYHTYRLESLIVPRNLGRQGMREIPPNPPGAPILQTLIHGYCGGVKLSWLAPVNQPGMGQVESYVIQWNDLNNGVFPFLKDVGPNTDGIVTGLDPTRTYYFTVEATNSYGKQVALVPGTTNVAVLSAQPQNRTTPGTPNTDPADPSGATAFAPGTAGGGFASGGAQATSPPEEINQITVTWTPPTLNLTPNNQGVVVPGGTAIGLAPAAGEITRWKVYRSTTANFNPTPADEVLTTAPNTLSATSSLVTFIDRTALNCVTYYYKVQASEPCETNASCAGCNVGTATGITPIYPLAAQPGIPGRAQADANPAAPTALMIQPIPPAPPMAGWCNPVRCNQVYLRWTKVITDDQPTPKPIIVDNYEIVREQYNFGSTTPDVVVDSSTPGFETLFSVTDTAPGVGQYMDWVDTTGIDIRDGFGQPITYRYYVRARQCLRNAGPPAIYTYESTLSPPVLFPCAFAAADPLIGVTLTLDGDGMTPATAWLTNNPLSQVEVTGAGLTSVQAMLDSGAGLVDLGTVTGSGPTYGFPLVNTEIGQLYALYIIAKDGAGCSRVYQRWVEEATATGCCLANFDNDPSIVSYIPGTSFVDITFRNLCSQALNIQPSGVQFIWDPAITNNGASPALATTLTTVEFPSTSTGSAILTVNDTAAAGNFAPRALNLTPPPATVPPALNAIPRNSSTYVVRLNFNRILGNANSPVSRACVIYRRTGVDSADQNCKILPTPPSSFNVCN